MNLLQLDQVKLQSQILIPLVKIRQFELGKDRANAIIRKALGDLYRKYGEVELTRKQMIMQAASHCDFHYVLKTSR